MRYVITATAKTPNDKIKSLRAKTQYLVGTLRLWRGLWGNLERISITRDKSE